MILVSEVHKLIYTQYACYVIRQDFYLHLNIALAISNILFSEDSANKIWNEFAIQNNN